MSSKTSRLAPRSHSLRHWPHHSSAPPAGYTPLSGTPPSPSARQARLLSPSHSLPEFLPVLDESSTLKAPLILPSSSFLHSSSSSSRQQPQLPPLPHSHRRSHYDLRRCVSVSSGSSSSLSNPGEQPKDLTEWVPHLMVFSMLCLVVTVASVAYSVSVVDQYDRTETGTFFQVSDIHWDPLYRYHATPTSFCRVDLLAASDKPFGQYGCDSPLLLLKTALMEMQGTHSRPDFVLISGDSVAHNLTAWQTLSALAKVDEAVVQTFDRRFTKRLHALGEQELAVLEQGVFNLTDWLASVARVWNSSLNDASDDAYGTFLRGGYYMAVIPSQAKGGPSRKFSDSDESPETSNVAVLVLNTLLYSAKEGALQKQMDCREDPQGQLAWLQQQLHQARHWGRKVVIAGHLPPGMDSVRGEPMWREEYVEKYMGVVLEHSDVVVGQLFGYLHRDHFTLMHDDNPKVVPEWGVEGERRERKAGSRVFGRSYASIGRSLGHASPGGVPPASRKVPMESGGKDVSSSRSKNSGWEGEGGSTVRMRAAQRDGQMKGKTEDEGQTVSIGSTVGLFGARQGVVQRRELTEAGLLGGGRSMVGERLREFHIKDASVASMSAEGAATSAHIEGRRFTGNEKDVEAAPRKKERERRKGVGEWHPVVIDSDSTLAVMIAPSLSPVLFNRPAFRAFTYDRAGLLLDYTQHTANLQLQGAEQMWEVQYGVRSEYGLAALDGSNFAELSSSFFNATGSPTAAFTEFCELRSAGNHGLLKPFDCCTGCPNFMRCAMETSTIDQFQSCNETLNGDPTSALRR